MANNLTMHVTHLHIKVPLSRFPLFPLPKRSHSKRGCVTSPSHSLVTQRDTRGHILGKRDMTVHSGQIKTHNMTHS